MLDSIANVFRMYFHFFNEPVPVGNGKGGNLPKGVIASVIVLGVMLVSPSVHSSEPTEPFDNWQLLTNCSTVGLIVTIDIRDHSLNKHSIKKESVERAVRSRLRGAGIYEELSGQLIPFLGIDIDYGGGILDPNAPPGLLDIAYNYSIEFHKILYDPITESHFPAVTWVKRGPAGVIGGANLVGERVNQLILSTTAETTDFFLDEYLRVNGDACRLNRKVD